jgi:hypothetical protein
LLDHFGLGAGVSGSVAGIYFKTEQKEKVM